MFRATVRHGASRVALACKPSGGPYSPHEMKTAPKSVHGSAHSMHTCIFADLDTAFGTLWWVREAEWARALRNYTNHGNRKSHPGLSLDEAADRERPSYVLMLHGRSECRGDCVAVRGLERKDRDRTAYFGQQIEPARIEARFFTSWTIELKHDDLNWTRDAAVIRNHDKPHITPHEETELHRWLERKRSRQPWCER